MSASTPSGRRPPGRATPRPRSRPAAGSWAGDALGTALSAAVTAGLVALIGIALSMIVTVGSWALAPHTADSGPETASRMAVAFWLYVHRVPLDVGGVALGIVPLGLLLLPGALAYAGGRHLGRASRLRRPATLSDLTGAVIPYALVYGVVAAVVAGLVRSDDVRPAPLAAFVAATLVAGVGAALGAIRAAGLGPAVPGLLSRPVRDIVAAATVATATLLTLSAVVCALALAVGFPDAVEMFRALDGGWGGGPLLVLLTVAFVPNLVLWTASFATGAGFTLGVGGSVAPQGISYGALPVFPPLAAVPPEGQPGPWGYLVLVAPLVAGYAAGSLVVRRAAGLRAEHLAARAAAGGALGGVALGVLAWLSAGAAGTESLAQVGPVGWQVGLVAAVEMSLVAAIVAWELDRRGSPSLPTLIDLRDRVGVPERVRSLLRSR